MRTHVHLNPLLAIPQRMIRMNERVVSKDGLQRASVLLVWKGLMPYNPLLDNR